MSEQIAEYLLSILRFRANDPNRSNDFQMAYCNAATMLDYAMREDWECLSQFDETKD